MVKYRYVPRAMGEEKTEWLTILRKDKSVFWEMKFELGLNRWTVVHWVEMSKIQSKEYNLKKYENMKWILNGLLLRLRS